MPAIPEVQKMADEISNRIQDLSRNNEDNASMALSLVIIKLLNGAYPPNLSPGNVALIRGNYPEATQEDIDQRALSKPGLMTALSIFNQASTIVMDYSPLTNCVEEQAIDLADNSKKLKAMSIADKAYDDMIAVGYTPFGAMTTMLSMGLNRSKEDGTPGTKLVRPLIEFMETALRPNEQERQADEARMIDLLCKSMGISKAEAKRYIKQAKGTRM